jgi:NADH:ubiquinone oxidoreductase subunit C
MFGVVFIGHPDLRRILTDYGFQGVCSSTYKLNKAPPAKRLSSNRIHGSQIRCREEARCR